MRCHRCMPDCWALLVPALTPGEFLVGVPIGPKHLSEMTGAEGLKVSQEELDKHSVDLALRDACAHLLIPLNKCRRATFYLPWKCEDERHGYEACQYVEYRKRAVLKSEQS